MMNPHYHTVQEVMNVQETCAVCNHIQVKGLQRQIDALKQCLKANGIVLNQEDEDKKEWYKMSHLQLSEGDWGEGELLDREREVKG